MSAEYSEGRHLLSALGEPCAKVVEREYEALSTEPLFSGDLEQLATTIAKPLSEWEDRAARAAALQSIFATIRARQRIDATAIARWVLSHPNDPEKLKDCLSVKAPDEVSITHAMPQTGSQKKVYLATWATTQRQVVLKKIEGSPEEQVERIQREILGAHPLSWAHPNIIETHILRNDEAEAFLIEEYIDVLNDDSKADGIIDAANLMYDLCNALVFLHDHKLMHGDIKPDNIGRRPTASTANYYTYILLDFGVCRSFDKFATDVSATGSLRTRAPELLLDDSTRSAQQADIWALGATVFKALVGRFPLFDHDQEIPRVSNSAARSACEKELVSRINNLWDQYVDINAVPQPIQEPLSLALKRDPAERTSAKELKTLLERHLPAYVQLPSAVGRFSPLEQLEQLAKFLPEKRILALVPAIDRKSIEDVLKSIEATQTLPEGCETLIATVRSRLS